MRRGVDSKAVEPNPLDLSLQPFFRRELRRWAYGAVTASPPRGVYWQYVAGVVIGLGNGNVYQPP